MDRQFNSEIKRYRREIKHLLLCKNSIAKAFMKDFDNELFNFIEENKVSDMETIYAQFGTAEEVARSFFEFADIRKISKGLRCTKTILTALIVALCMVLAGLLYAIEDVHSEKQNVLTHIIEETQQTEFQHSNETIGR